MRPLWLPSATPTWDQPPTQCCRPPTCSTCTGESCWCPWGPVLLTDRLLFPRAPGMQPPHQWPPALYPPSTASFQSLLANISAAQRQQHLSSSLSPSSSGSGGGIHCPVPRHPALPPVPEHQLQDIQWRESSHWARAPPAMGDRSPSAYHQTPATGAPSLPSTPPRASPTGDTLRVSG